MDPDYRAPATVQLVIPLAFHSLNNILAQKDTVSEVHTTQRSDRQKEPRSSDAWVSKRRITRPTMNMPRLATLCVACTHPSGQWLPSHLAVRRDMLECDAGF